MSENLTWPLEWGQRGANLPALTRERQPSSVTHSHSQTSFMCKSFLDLLFTHCALRYLLNQVINVMAGLEICFILWKRIIICWKRENQLHATSWNNNQLQFLKNNIFFVVLFDTTNEHIFSLQWRHYNCSTVVAVVQTLALKRLQMIHFSMKDGSNIKLLDKNCFYKYLSVTLQFRRYSLLIKDCLK